jgi:ribosomal protein S1
MSAMTDHERREEVTEPELLNELLGAAETTAAETDTAAEVPVPAPAAEEPPEEAAEPTAEEQPVAEAAQEEAPLQEQAVGETGAIPVPPPPTSGEAEGASYTPVAEEGGRPRRLKDLEAGMELEGRVTSIALYGIFVDIGVGRDGLVHISEMSDTRIDSPSDLVQIGDTVKVRIKSIDPDARRISLTMRSKERGERSRSRGTTRRPEVNRDALADLKPGDTIEGVITGIAPFGAFVDIGVGKDGLVHVSELAEGRVDRPEDAVQVGERYTFKLLEVDPEGTRISLSLRKAQRTQKLQSLEPGTIMDGTVSGLAPFGAFVDIGVGRDGLVHISELSEQRVGKVEDAVKPGDKVQVRVLEVDPQSKRISLTMRLEDRPRRGGATHRPRRGGALPECADRAGGRRATRRTWARRGPRRTRALRSASAGCNRGIRHA